MPFSNDISSQARSAAVRASAQMLDMYDREIGARETFDALVQTRAPVGNQITQYIDWATAFPDLEEWVDERAVDEIFSDRITITMKLYEKTYAIDRLAVEMDGEAAIVSSESDMAGFFAKSVARGPLRRAYELLRDGDTQTSYDGQTFFHASAHTHPNGSTFGNVIDLSSNSIDRTAVASPTAAEAQRELNWCISKLQDNALIKDSIVEAPSASNLTVIVKSDGVFRGYRDLLTQTTISNTSNPYFGTFRLLRDTSPLSGDENDVIVLKSDPGGPRPLLFLPKRMPGGINVDEATLNNRKIHFGVDAVFGVGLGFPQCAVKVTP